VSRLLAAFAALLLAPAAAGAEQAVATFAGGCFWCMEPPFEGLPGVSSVTAGYTGGTRKDPSYEEVSAGGTGHAEAVQIVYEPAQVSFEKLLDVFWRNVDPTVADRQFCDVGSQYRSAIFVHDATQRQAAEASRAEVQKRLGVPVKTEIADAGPFYRAEEYHQDYARKNPLRYRYYRHGCGRDARLEEIWGKDREAQGGAH
jgi:peptide-methionine (S)-S-oxide reductase